MEKPKTGDAPIVAQGNEIPMHNDSSEEPRDEMTSDESRQLEEMLRAARPPALHLTEEQLQEAFDKTIARAEKKMAGAIPGDSEDLVQHDNAEVQAQ